jgi:hypothetical protein
VAQFRVGVMKVRAEEERAAGVIRLWSKVEELAPSHCASGA